MVTTDDAKLAETVPRCEIADKEQKMSMKLSLSTAVSTIYRQQFCA